MKSNNKGAGHARVLALLHELDSLRCRQRRGERSAGLAGVPGHEVSVHGLLEQGIFFPLLRAAIDDEDLLADADAEATGARDLIRQLDVMVAADDDDGVPGVPGAQMAHAAAELIRLPPL